MSWADFLADQRRWILIMIVVLSVIDLWASWCPPCRAEMPAIQKVYQHHAGAE